MEEEVLHPELQKEVERLLGSAIGPLSDFLPQLPWEGPPIPRGWNNPGNPGNPGRRGPSRRGRRRGPYERWNDADYLVYILDVQDGEEEGLVDDPEGNAREWLGRVGASEADIQAFASHIKEVLRQVEVGTTQGEQQAFDRAREVAKKYMSHKELYRTNPREWRRQYTRSPKY